MTRAAYSMLLTCLVLTCAIDAHAQTDADKATARDLFGQGQDALKANDCEAAAERFERADKLYSAPTIRVGLARAYVCLGQFVKGREKYNLVIREKLPADASGAFKNAVEDAKKEITGLDSKIGYVSITIEGPTVPKVTIDGENVPVAALGVNRPMDPGEHVVKADANGFKPAEVKVTVTAQQVTPVALRLEADASETPDDDDDDDVTVTPGDAASGDTLRLVGFIGIGVGAAGLILGGVTGGLALGKHGDLTDACGEDGMCPADQQENLDDFNTFGTVSTIGFIAGGVIAAAGLVLVLVAPSGGSEQATLTVGPTGATATIRF